MCVCVRVIVVKLQSWVCVFKATAVADRPCLEFTFTVLTRGPSVICPRTCAPLATCAAPRTLRRKAVAPEEGGLGAAQGEETPPGAKPRPAAESTEGCAEPC